MKIFVAKCLPIYLILLYRLVISPLFPARCRFDPTCSSFAMDALEKHGVLLGGWLALKRLFRCHPLSKHSGYDPIP